MVCSWPALLFPCLVYLHEHIESLKPLLTNKQTTAISTGIKWSLTWLIFQLLGSTLTESWMKYVILVIIYHHPRQSCLIVYPDSIRRQRWSYFDSEILDVTQQWHLICCLKLIKSFRRAGLKFPRKLGICSDLLPFLTLNNNSETMLIHFKHNKMWSLGPQLLQVKQVKLKMIPLFSLYTVMKSYRVSESG